MAYSVTDVAGFNRISRRMLGNAAHADRRAGAPGADDKPAIGLTMFDVTTPCVQQVTAALAGNYDCQCSTPPGPAAVAREAGLINVTTTEVCNLLIARNPNFSSRSVDSGEGRDFR